MVFKKDKKLKTLTIIALHVHIVKSARMKKPNGERVTKGDFLSSNDLGRL
jgi:hypothetical protein